MATTTRAVDYMREVRAEVRKVTWPTWEDLRKSTGVIIVVVVILGVLIGVIDFLFSRILIDFLPRRRRVTRTRFGP
jgi:preprotein translocase subunit SecE